MTSLLHPAPGQTARTAAPTVGRPPDPELRAVLDAAYDQYRRRVEAGDPPSIESFVAGYPAVRDTLRDLLSVDRHLDQYPDALLGPDVRWPAPGERVGEFQVVRELGRGGFGRAYLAREATVGDRGVVLKVTVGLDEAGTQGPLTHPNIMPVLAARQIDGRSVVVMPFLGTATLETVLGAVRSSLPGGRLHRASVLRNAYRPRPAAGEPLPDVRPEPASRPASLPKTIAAIGAGVADALAFLHAQGFAHQDVKPSNVLLAPSGRPYVLDFNLSARAATAVGGTVEYMAPEQLAAFVADEPARYDRAAADVFSLGVVLHELVTGRRPITPTGPASDPDDVAARSLNVYRAGVPPLRAGRWGASARLAAVVNDCLTADPARRPTAADVAQALAAIAAPRRRTAVAVTAALVTAGLAVGWLGAGLAGPSVDQRRGTTDTAAVRTDLGALRLSGRAGDWRVVDLPGADEGRAFAHAAYALSSSGFHREAAEVSGKALARGVRHPTVYSNRAYNLYQLGRYADAWNDATAAVACGEPVAAETRLLRARIALSLFHTARVRDVLPTAVRDVDAVRRAGPRSAHVSLTAAELYVAAAQDNPALFDAAVTAVREAVESGANPALIRSTRSLSDPLKHHPGYEAALAATPGLRAGPVPLAIRPRFSAGANP